jgi:hypothetical protein
MGFAVADVTTPLSSGPSPNVPVAKQILAKAFAVARTDTTGTLKAVLPADATIIDFLITGAASNAGTTATLSLGSTSASSNEYVLSQDVKTASGALRPSTTYVNTALPNLTGFPLGGDKQIYAKYAETGGASSAGNWTVIVYYVR